MQLQGGRYLLLFLQLTSIGFAIVPIISQPPRLSSLWNSSQSPFTELQNLTVGLPPPPQAFDVQIEIGGPKLRTTDCLLNVVDTLRKLALGDFRAKIVDGTEYRLDSYPRVSIIVNTPRRKRSVLACYVIWALILGVEGMIERKKFELAQVQLKWNDELLGWVHFIDNPSFLSLDDTDNASDTPDTAKRSLIEVAPSNNSISNINVTNVISTDFMDDLDEARLNTTFSPLPGDLGVYDVFFPIVNAIADMAEYSKDFRAQALVGGFEGYKGIVCILSVEHMGPPFLTYGWLIRAISRIPMWMVQQRRFGEVEIMMVVDEVEIAYGKLTTKPCI